MRDDKYTVGQRLIVLAVGVALFGAASAVVVGAFVLLFKSSAC